MDTSGGRMVASAEQFYWNGTAWVPSTTTSAEQFYWNGTAWVPSTTTGVNGVIIVYGAGASGQTSETGGGGGGGGYGCK